MERAEAKSESVHTPDTWLQSFTIITTTPNELTREVHNRMPVIVRPEDYEEWLMRVDGEAPPAGSPTHAPSSIIRQDKRREPMARMNGMSDLTKSLRVNDLPVKSRFR